MTDAALGASNLRDHRPSAFSIMTKCGRGRVDNARFCGGCGNDFGGQAADSGTPLAAEPVAEVPLAAAVPLAAEATRLEPMPAAAEPVRPAAPEPAERPRWGASDEQTPWDTPLDATRWDLPVFATRVEPPAAAQAQAPGWAAPDRSPRGSRSRRLPTRRDPARRARGAVEDGGHDIRHADPAAGVRAVLAACPRVPAAAGPRGGPRATVRWRHSGYATTKDSNEVLTGITDTGGGSLTANVSFTSHQSPADSPDQSACNDWQISLYLVPQAASYVMTAAPAGYTHSDTDC
jgi:hypothetical protein